jgi:hypothetical protein
MPGALIANRRVLLANNVAWWLRAPGLASLTDTFVRDNGGLGANWIAPNWAIATNAAAGTPVAGSELISNGGFASDTTGWTAAGSGVLASVAGGLVGNALQITNGAASNGIAAQDVPGTPTAVGQWYSFSSWHKNGTGTGLLRLATTPTGNNYYSSGALSDAAGVSRTQTLRATATTFYSRLLCDAVLGNTTLWDSVSLMRLAPVSLSAFTLAQRTSYNVSVEPTLTAGTHAGCWLAVDNPYAPRYGVLAYHEGTNAHLDRLIDGQWAPLINAAGAYAAGRVLLAKKSGASFSLWYNGAQIGTTQTISNPVISAGRWVGMFSTYASNTMGTFTLAAYS